MGYHREDGKIDVNDFLKMNKEQILKENNGRKWDCVLMNPPYAHKEDNCLDVKFINKVSEISNHIVAIFPNCLNHVNGPYRKFLDSNIIKSIELLESNKTFDIFVGWKYVGIYDINPNDNYDKISIKLNNKNYNIDNNKEKRQDFIKQINWGNLYEFCQHTKDLYNELKDKYKSMCHDGHGFIYEENKGGLHGIKKPEQKKLERVKKYLKEGIYKYCIYKGSGNNEYDKVQEWNGQDPDKIFNGQACWLTNSETVKNNIKYWMECPLFDAWRRYYFNFAKLAVCWAYMSIPALDFEMDDNKFKEYVDSLNKFDKKDIEILKEYKVHNADKL